MKRVAVFNSKHIKRVLSSLLCFILVFTLVGCVGSTDVNGPNSSDNSSTENSSNNSSTEDTVSIDPISGEINTTAKIEAALKEVEQNVQMHDPNLSSSEIGYAETEAKERRNEILNTPNTEEIYKIKGTKYYISPTGSNTNDGLSPKTAFENIDALDLISLKSGDAVLFERDGVYRFKRPISAKNGVTYGSYGKGAKPAIFGSAVNVAKSEWTPSKKKNVWQVDCPYGAPSGLFINHGEEIGVLKSAGLGLLENNGDFYYDTALGVLYLYNDKGNPANLYESIEVSPSFSIFSLVEVDDVVIDNICMKYASFGVISSVVNNMHVTNCEFGYLGGKAGANARKGNAIEIYPGPCSDIYFDHNWVYQTFDSAITWQGHVGNGCVYKNISFSDNLLEYNNADFEFWEIKDAVLDGFVIDNNIMRFTSMGWGTCYVDGVIRGIEGCLQGNVREMKLLDDILITNNIFDCPARQIVWFKATVEQRDMIKTSGNTVYVKKSYRTTNEIVRDYPDGSGKTGKRLAVNATEFEQAMRIFDSTAKLHWYE